MIDNPSLFFGTVEDVDDPLQVGRVRVRVVAMHSTNKSLIPTESLPWSHVSSDANNAAFDGLGWSPTGIQVGTVVWGFYTDGDKLEPFVVGTYHGVGEDGTHDVNPLARGIVSPAMAANKTQFATAGVGVRATSPNSTPEEDAGQAQTSSGGAADPALAVKNDISAKQAAQLETVKLTDAQVATLKSVCAGDTKKYAFMCNVLSIENRGKPAPSNAVSPAGAAGPFQLMPATAKAVGLTGVGGANDERNSFPAAAGGVSDLYDELNKRYNGNRRGMYADYNGGPKFGKAEVAGSPLSNSENNQYVAMAMYLEEKNGTSTPPAQPNTDPDTTNEFDPNKWMSIAEKEIGIKEVSGSGANARILEYHAQTSLNASSDETPWCSAFACWVMKQAGIAGTRSASARSWVNWGSSLTGPRYGAVVVITRGNDPRLGHVGFVSRFDKDYVWLLAGNQTDSVSVVRFSRANVLAYRWPGPTNTLEAVSEAEANPTWSQPIGGATVFVPPAAGAPIVVGAGPYPHNRVFQSKSGHVIELDDTPGNARMHHYHMSGTFREVLNEGTLTDKSVQDRYTITTFNSYEMVGKNYSLTVNGTAYHRYGGAAVFHSDTTLFLEGGSRVQVNSPLVAFSEQIAAPSASFQALDVLGVIEGTCKNALWAAQAGSIGGAAQAVINKNINTAMEASVKAAQDMSADKFTASFGPTPPAASTAREGDIWVPTGVSGTQSGQQIFKDGAWVPDTESKVRMVPVTAAGEDGKPTYFIPDSATPVTVIAGSSEPILSELEKAEAGHMWVNKLTGVVKEWAPVAMKWAVVGGMAAKIYSDDTNNVGGQPAGVVASKAIDGYEKAVQALSSLAKTSTALDGQVKSFYQESEPTPEQNAAVGDYWFDVDNQYRMYVLTIVDNAPVWKRDESEIGILLKNLSGLQTGKSTTFFQEEDPTLNVAIRVATGDIWFQPEEKLSRRWDGSQWVLVKSSGDSINGGTISNTSITTNANETQERLVIDSATNSTSYYGPDGTGTVTELARTGGTSEVGTESVQKLGSTTSPLIAQELESSATALKVTGGSEFNGPVLIKDAMATTKPLKVGPYIIGSGTPPAAASYPLSMMIFATSDATPVVTPCYSDGVNWRKFKDDTVFI